MRRRRPHTTTPHVYLHLHKDEWTDEPLALWVKDCPRWFCRAIAERLVELHSVRGIRLDEEEDLHYRYGYVRTLYTLTFFGLSPSIDEDMLRWLIEHEFHKLQSSEVEWVTSYRILNLKRKKD